MEHKVNEDLCDLIKPLSEFESPLPVVRAKPNLNWLKKKPRRSPNAGKKSTGLQDPGTRFKYLYEVHGAQALLKMAADEKELGKLSSYDATLVSGMINAIKGSGEERERILNRMFGKVPDRQINLNINVDTDPQQLSDKALDLLARLSDE